jgi:hypothetical protein
VKKRKFLPVAIALVAVIAVSGVAYAYWTASGAGVGTAKAAAGVSDLQASSIPLTNMYPGDGAQNIVITIHNPSTQKVWVTSVSTSISGVDMVIGHAGTTCGPSDFTLNATPPESVGYELSVGASLTLDVPTYTPPTIKFNDTGANQDACKGATVNLSFTIS